MSEILKSAKFSHNNRRLRIVRRRELRSHRYASAAAESLCERKIVMAQGKPLCSDSVVRVADCEVSSRFGDEVAILELDRSVYYGLNYTGAFLWNLMQKPVRVNEMRAALVEEFDVDPETAEQDLLSVLADLRDAGLIEHVDFG
jgi:hypothetical protein